MWPDRVSNPGPLTYESGALPTALRGPALIKEGLYIAQLWSEFTMIVLTILIVSCNNSDSYDNYWSCFLKQNCFGLVLQLPYFFGLKTEFFFLPKSNPKNLDLSYKTD